MKTFWLTPAAFALMLALAVGGILNWWYEGVRLASPLLNYGAMLMILIVPFGQVAQLAWSRSRPFQIVGGIVASPVIAVSLMLTVPVALLYVAVLFQGHDPLFEHLRTLTLPRYQLSVYRTDGGATTPYGIAIRREQRVAPGVYLVKTIHRIHPAYDAMLVPKDDRHVRVIWSRYGESSAAQSNEATLQLEATGF